MKRSEMQDIIWNAGIPSWLANEFPEELKYRITNEILEAIEEVGMLPPLNENSHHEWDYVE